MTGPSDAVIQALFELMQQNSKQQDMLKKLFEEWKKSAGSGAGGGAGDGVAGLGKGAMAANVALGVLKLGAAAVGAVFGVLTSIVGKTVGVLFDTTKSLFNFAKAAAEGQAKIADFLDAFSNLPFFIGNFFSLAAEVYRYQESMLDHYLQMTRVGAAFSGSLDEMRGMAMRAGMTLGELTKFSRNYSEVLSSAIGGVDGGLRKFSEVQNLLTGSNSRYARTLFGLGFTVEDVSELIGQTFSTYRDMSRVQVRDNNELAKSVNSYATELDAITKLTGKSREEQEKQARALAMEEEFKYFLQQFPDDLKPKILSYINGVTSVFGKDISSLVKQQIMTGMFVPLDDGMKQAVLRMGDGGDTIVRTLADVAMNANLSEEQRINSMYQMYRMYGAQFKSNILDPMGSFGFTMNQLKVPLFQNAEAFRAARLAAMSDAQARKQIADIFANIAKQSGGNAQDLQRNQRALIDLGQVIMTLFNTAFGPLATSLLGFAKQITTELIPIFKSIATWFNNTFRELGAAYKKGGLQEFFRVLSIKIGEAFTNTANFLSPLIDALKGAIRNMWEAALPTLEASFAVLTTRMFRIAKDVAFGGTPEQKILEEQAYINELKSRPSLDFMGRRSLEKAENKIKKYQEEIKQREKEDTELFDNIYRQSSAEVGRRRTLREALVPSASERLRSPTPTPKLTSAPAATVVSDEYGDLTTVPVAGTDTGPEKVAEAVYSLNNTMRTLVAINQEIKTGIQDNVRATKGLGHDAYRYVG